MRIAVVIESFNPMAGGNERSTDQVMRELVRRGHDVTLITGMCRESDEPRGVTTLAMSRNKSSSALRLWRFARWARQALVAGRFDTSLSMTMAVPARVMQPRGGTVRETLARNIAMRGGGWPSLKKRLEVSVDPKQRLLLALEKRTLGDPLVYRVVALSGYVVRQLAEHYAFPDERAVVIPNAAVMPEADAQQRRAWRQEVRTTFEVDEGSTLFLMAAQNPSLKGYPTLLRALQELRARGEDAVAVLAGGFGAAEQARADRADTSRPAGAKPLREMLRVAGPTRQMAPLFCAADVTVLPTWYDPSSKVVLESLMLGTPAISTAYNGASDHLVAADGRGPRGLVVQDPGDAVELADAMQRLCDPAFRAVCSTACAGLADRLSMARHVAALEAVLEEAGRA